MWNKALVQREKSVLSAAAIIINEIDPVRCCGKQCHLATLLGIISIHGSILEFSNFDFSFGRIRAVWWRCLKSLRYAVSILEISNFDSGFGRVRVALDRFRPRGKQHLL